ncbi:MAG: hypothetical protein H8E17_03630 [Deltaproteobacteria bacterium]|nr:hypothetical protein [Deltaproteobacteria bacterium]
MAVPQKDVIVQNGGLINANSWKQPGQRGRVLPPFKVVVPPDLDVSCLFRIRIVEFGQLLINGGVGDVDLIKGPVFPQLLRIAQFNVGEVIFQIVVERRMGDAVTF